MYNTIFLSQVSLGIYFGLIVVFLSYKFKFLTFSGSVATFLLAVLIFGFGGWKWAVPVLVFFIISSLLSKAGKKRKDKFKNTFEKTGIRDYLQVIANGGLAGVFVLVNIFYPDPVNYQLYLVALAAANSDTWATELGVLSNSTPILISTFKPVEPGVSGAISVYGTLASLLGSFLIAASGYFFGISLMHLFLITLSGFSGSIIDSILGASVQGQFQCIQCQAYTEKKIHCNQKSVQIKGYKWMTNDLVNIFSGTGAVIAFIVFLFLSQS